METATNQPLKKVFGYIRVSGESQVKEDGPVRQRKAIQEYARANAMRVVQWFVEEAVSGTVESKDRPAFSEMLVALLSNGVRTVLVEHLDRLARDVFVQEGTIKLFKEKNLELISVKQPDLCGDDPNRVAMRQMMGVFAQLDRANIVLKLRAARQRAKAKTGRCEGRKPFGVREGESAVLARMKELAVTMTYKQLADVLNAEGIKTRTGGQWFPGTVYNILRKNKQRKQQ
jgi:DNA invertase Pin-like site-specific DNA recombinase